LLSFEEVHAEGQALDVFRSLISEYQNELPIDLCFQNFQAEVADPFKKYGRPSGVVLLALWNGEVAGCGALQDLGENVCELKRIYIKGEYRRRGIARAISEYLIERGRGLGYATARLDTLRRLTGAIELYTSLGFKETAPYNYNPEEDIVYMERNL
jgi:putative acetyltransferase